MNFGDPFEDSGVVAAAGVDIEEREGPGDSESPGHSPLQVAAYEGHAVVVMVLPEHGAVHGECFTGGGF